LGEANLAVHVHRSEAMTKKKGLYHNIRERQASGEKMREKGDKLAPSEADFKNAAKTVKKKK